MWSSNVVLGEIFVVIEKARLNAGFFTLTLRLRLSGEHVTEIV